LKHLLHLFSFSVKGDSQNSGIIEIETSTMSIHLMPLEELKSVVGTPVDVKEDNEEDVEKVLADIAKSCELVKPFLDKTGARRVEESTRNGRSVSKTEPTERRARSWSTDEDSDEESEDDAPPAKKKK
jgi:hypothetical protein